MLRNLMIQDDGTSVCIDLAANSWSFAESIGNAEEPPKHRPGLVYLSLRGDSFDENQEIAYVVDVSGTLAVHANATDAPQHIMRRNGCSKGDKSANGVWRVTLPYFYTGPIDLYSLDYLTAPDDILCLEQVAEDLTEFFSKWASHGRPPGIRSEPGFDDSVQ